MEVDEVPVPEAPASPADPSAEQVVITEAFAEYADAVHAYARRYVGPDDADDVVQRTFLDAWRSASRYDPRQRLSSWLFTIAHHRAVDVLRSRRGSAVDLDAVRELCGEDGRETVERYADAADVRAALARVPEHERCVLELMYFGELTQRETADRLGLPVGTVKARASRGTRRLGEILRAAQGE
jgi:RNA polymerase sigma-70 factor (ECF subfamily)